MTKNRCKSYAATWSEEDQQFVGTCDQYPSLSWLADTNHEAIEGIKRVVADVEADMVAEREGDDRDSR